MKIEAYIDLIEKDLLPNIVLKTENLFDPIEVMNRSRSWKTIGNGNYAAVFFHEEKPDWVVKVYGRSQHELKKEIEVYKKLGEHRAFSTLYAYGENYLVLKRIEGVTLFNAVIKGIPIPASVIEDIDQALKYAISKGLNPFDVHGKNIVMNGKKGYVVDISDFYKEGYCSKWHDLKRAYKKIYKPFIYQLHPPIPLCIMDGVRKGYRYYKKLKVLIAKKSLKMKIDKYH
ncbi:serine/threonine protein kinase [Neobacillus sp. LXY-4]|uniref:serine/threonine protein kinase n=1 Tax=Neobacillus sp. LXY-4 TaxID=3379826 RepID=UPI003EE3C80A